MRYRAGDAAGDIELWSHCLTSWADLAAVFYPSQVGSDTCSAHRSAKPMCELGNGGEAFLPYASSTRDNALRRVQCHLFRRGGLNGNAPDTLCTRGQFGIENHCLK